MRKLFLLITILLGAVLPVVAQDSAPATQPLKPGQVTGLKGVFRNGQTFLTYTESAGQNNHYRVYRSTSPIEKSEQLTPENLAGEVGDFTSLNLMASIKRIDLNANREYEMPKRVYFRIAEDSAYLTDDTGLFVYTAKAEEKAYYAVTAVVNGQEDKTIVTGPEGNSLSEAIVEKIEPVEAVLQNDKGDYVHWTDDKGTDVYPGMSSLPSVPYNFRIRIPGGPKPYALIGLLHGMLFQYNQQDFQDRPQRQDNNSSTANLYLDVPVMQGRIKGLDLRGVTPSSWSRGVGGGSSRSGGRGESSRESGSATSAARDQLAPRVLWTFSWVKQHFPIDADRVVIDGGSMGGN